MPENLSEEIVKDGAQNVTQKDIQKVISRSEELQRKFSARGPLARFVEDGKLLIVWVIDNLLKGAWGQAVHNMNLLFGLHERTGLNLKASAF